MKASYTKYAILALSITALSSISLATQASPKGGHNPHSSGSQTHSNNGAGHSNYRPHGGGHGGYRRHGNPHGGYGYRPHGVGHGYYRHHTGYAGYYQPYPVHGTHFIPSISANIHLPGLNLSLH